MSPAGFPFINKNYEISISGIGEEFLKFGF